MAPVAAYLSQGINPAEVGPAVTFFHKLNWQQPIVQPQSITGTVVMIDSFGNLLTRVPAWHRTQKVCRAVPWSPIGRNLRDL